MVISGRTLRGIAFEPSKLDAVGSHARLQEGPDDGVGGVRRNTWLSLKDKPWQLATPGDQDRLLVLTKTDCPRGTDLKHLAIRTSSRTGLGVAELRREIARKLAAGSTQESHIVAQTVARCGDSLRLSQQSLRRARDVFGSQGGEELIAAEVRTTLEELGKVAGAVYTEDILDRIFSRFCIGK